MYSASNPGVFRGVQRLLDYFHMDNRPLPKEVTDLRGAVDFLNEETGLILVPTSLEGDWYRTCAGPLLVQDQEGMDLAVLPDWRGRYYFLDEGTGHRVYITEKNAGQFPLAYSVTADFPGAAVTASGLLGRMLGEMSGYEGAMLAVWGLLGGGLWVLLASRVRSALSDVILRADQSALIGGVGAILAIALLEALLVFTGRQVVGRVAEKGALAALLALGSRLYAAGEVARPDGAAAALADLRDNGERVMTWLLTALWEVPGILVVLVALADRSPQGAITGGVLALVLHGGAALVFRALSRRQPDDLADQERRGWLLRQAADRRLGIRRPFPRHWRRPRQGRSLGAAWWAAALLAIPMVYFTVTGGHSAARLVQTMLLYLPAVALPMGTLLGTAGAGRSMAEIRCLLPLAERQPTGSVPLPPMGSVFELKDVTFSYPGRTKPVLQGVNLRLHPGEAVGILGATGAGKTTLERLMTGLLRPTGGNIYYGGIELARYNASALRRRVSWEQGADILLCSRMPEQRDNRACVVFSTREEALAGCDRIVRLEDGALRSQ